MSETPDGIAERAAAIVAHRCPHEMGYDRELGPMGCALELQDGGECFCAAVIPTVRDLAAEITALRAQLAVKDKALREALPNHRCEYCGDEALDPHPCRMSSGHSWKPLNTGSQS